MRQLIASIFVWLFGSLAIWFAMRGCAGLRFAKRRHNELAVTVKRVMIERNMARNRAQERLRCEIDRMKRAEE